MTSEAKRALSQTIRKLRTRLIDELGDATESAYRLSVDTKKAGLPAAARGAMVTDVYPGGPAATAGLRPGDVLLRIGKAGIVDPADLRHREAALKPGTTVTLSGLRAGVPFHAEVTLAQRPPLSALTQMSG